jgi:hypothetical protein
LRITKTQKLKEIFEHHLKASVYYQRLRRFGFAHESLDFYSLACAARIFFCALMVGEAFATFQLESRR